jgi:hypothetical protein
LHPNGCPHRQSLFVSSSEKAKILHKLLGAKNQQNTAKLHRIFEEHKSTLKQHRNILKLFISVIAPNLAHKIFDIPQSVKLAWALLAETPTAVIERRVINFVATTPPTPSAPSEEVGQSEFEPRRIER